MVQIKIESSDFNLRMDIGQWPEIRPPKKRLQQMSLGDEASDIFAKLLKAKFPQCPYKVVHCRVKKSGSNKKKSPFLLCSIKCVHDGCTSFKLCIQDEPDDDDNATPEIVGTVIKSEGTHRIAGPKRRQVRAQERADMAKKVKEKGSLNVYYQTLADAEEYPSQSAVVPTKAALRKVT